MWLKQSTAVTVKMGPFVDSGDGDTDEAALTIQKADVRLSKNGGNMAAANADQGVGDAGAAYDEIGYYDISLDATDTNTLGRLKVMIHESGALHVWADYMVVPANTYDSLVGGSDNLDAEVATVATAAANKLADHTIRRTFQNACDSADGDAKTGRSLLGAIAKLVNKIASAGGVLTIYEDDDATSLFTQNITTNAAADPITTLDTV